MSGNQIKKEFGDYQTPLEFAKKVCDYLYSVLGIRPDKILEPNAGIGNFIKAAIERFEDCKEVFGIEINKEYCDICEAQFPEKKVHVYCDNIFEFDLSRFRDEREDVLVIGNPPWVTNSELSYNLPQKENFKNLAGTDAITGASNFDICEYIILQLIEAFKNTNTVIAMLCKTSVARNVMLELNRLSNKAEYVKMLNFNSGKVFGISASACLLVIKLSKTFENQSRCEVSEFENPGSITHQIICRNGVLSVEKEGILDLEGSCQCEWRQGVKHDCSAVMELEKLEKDKFRNKRNEVIDIEERFVFPLMKSSSFKTPIICKDFKKYVIVTQRKPREDTSFIEEEAPKTWAYLCENKALFEGRKSSIYKGAPAFSMFGVGDYSFSKYKVGISGFYKKPLFSILYNEEENGQTVMLDDTTYFLSFDCFEDAYTCMILLNSDTVQNFLFSISFQDAKRPYTKKVLQRLDLRKCVDNIQIEQLVATERKLGLERHISDVNYTNFKKNMGFL